MKTNRFAGVLRFSWPVNVCKGSRSLQTGISLCAYEQSSTGLGASTGADVWTSSARTASMKGLIRQFWVLMGVLADVFWIFRKWVIWVSNLVAFTCRGNDASAGSPRMVEVSWTPQPAIGTMRDHDDCIMVFFYPPLY